MGADSMSETGLQAFVPELVRMGVEGRLGAGAVLFREGDPGDSVALLLEGQLDVVHEAAGEETLLRTVESGAVVGEIAASAEGRARTATVRARTACRIVKVTAPRFRTLLRERPEILEQMYWMQVDRVRHVNRPATRAPHRTITDPLTHLYNYSFFRERLDLELDRARHTGDPVALVLFDIDHFKAYNEAQGHQ